MQDRAKVNHDLGKDSKIYHVHDKSSMVSNTFFGQFCTQLLAIHLNISLMVANAY